MVSPSLTLLRTQSDERLVVLAHAGHERAFEAIVERYRRPLLRHGRRLLGEARAEEAVQQAFLAAWAALERGDDVRHLSGWLHRIVHNAALNALRGERDDYAELREWLEGAGAPEDELERREMLRETLANLGSLPDRQREALLRIAVDGQSAEEVGGALGLSEGAVRQLLYRARTALRAAATALTPLPVAGWLARAEPLTERIAEAAAGAGTAGLGSILAKTSVVVVVAGTAAATPVVLDDDEPREPRRPPRAESTRAVEPPAPRATTPFAVSRPATPTLTETSRGGGSSDRSDNSGPGSSDSGSSGSSGSSGPGPSGSGDSDNSGSGSDSSGPGSGESDTSGSGSDSSGPGSGDSGSGGEIDNSGPGSLSSGSGSSGSGSSGSGSSGSGSSGSGSSGSGSSGSGSDDSDSSGSGSSGSGSDNSG